MTNASVLVRAARKSRGLTQRDLAQRTNVDQGRVSRFESGREAEFSTIERFLSGAGHRLYSAPTRRDDAATIAAAIRRYLRAALVDLRLSEEGLPLPHGSMPRTGDSGRLALST
ncbi:helix-turn-helix domain-containing protein [Microbacterium profundi]|uniref:Helix-turn-helix transcriptional regulator n=1 Tax=Microbacterium profundi TaxID=450380 RepID=A0ABV3LI83_9MICO|nr:helix-turn-helix transcriptional regulator [Microbacterium profundi]